MSSSSLMFNTSGHLDSMVLTKKCSKVDLLSEVLVLLSCTEWKKKTITLSSKNIYNGENKLQRTSEISWAAFRYVNYFIIFSKKVALKILGGFKEYFVHWLFRATVRKVNVPCSNTQSWMQRLILSSYFPCSCNYPSLEQAEINQTVS